MIKKQIIEKINEYEKIALFHHIKPDGDAISCSYGLMKALKIKFPNKKIVLIGNYEYLTENFEYLEFDKNYFSESIDSSFLAIAGDIVPGDRLEYNEEFKKAGCKIVFDHHKNVADKETYDLYWHEDNYGASAMQAYELVKEMNINLSEDAAFWIMFGILTDTGNFVYSLADSRPVAYVSELLKHISNEKMDFYYTESRKKTLKDIEALKYIFNNIVYDDQLVYLKVSSSNIKKYGLNTLKWKINTFGNIEGTKIWAIFFEKNDDEKGKWSVDLRSNGPHVNEVATIHGGGGHNRASGCWVKDDKELDIIIKELKNKQ